MLIHLIGHTTYVLLAISYLVRDIYWLRLIAIPASLCSVAFCYFGTDEPIWLIIGWNIVFLAVNSYQLGIIHLAAIQSHQSPEFARFVELIQPALSPADAIVLFRAGTLHEVDHVEEMLTERTTAEALYFIWSGRAEIRIRGKSVGWREQGAFLGEIGFLTKAPSTATVRVSPGSVILKWERTKLERALNHRPSLHAAFQRQLFGQVRERLYSRESQLTTLQEEAVVPA